MENQTQTQGSNGTDTQQSQAKNLETSFSSSPNNTLLIDGYDHGFTNGVFRIARHPYPEFIEGLEGKKLTSVRLNLIRQELRELRTKIQELWLEYNRQEGIALRSKHDVALLENKALARESQKREKKSRIELLESERKAINPYYNWIVAGLFILAGLVFIGADISITFQVFRQGLNMPSKEAWILAVGFASIAFIIKPAVDRIFEEPYLSGENKKRNYRFLLTVAAIALVTLGFMGYFRSTAFEFQEKDNALKNKLEIIDRDQDRDVYASNGSDRNDIQEQIFALGLKQYAHWTIRAAFTLSSILFALAGAICLSIGLPVTNLLHRKFVLRSQIQKLDQELRQISRDIDDNQRELSEKRFQKETAERLLERFPVIPFLEEKLESLKKDELSALEAYYREAEKAEKAWYEEGFVRGEKYTLNGELIFKPPFAYKGFRLNGQKRMTDNPKAAGSNGFKHPDGQSPPAQEPYYLHEQLRHFIDHNFNKKQQYSHGQDE